MLSIRFRCDFLILKKFITWFKNTVNAFSRDNSDADIIGANLYECYLQTAEHGRFDQLNLTELNSEYEKRNKFVLF